MQPWPRGSIECESIGRNRHHSGGVAARAEPFGVAGGAHSVGLRSGGPVRPNEIGTVDEVVFGEGSFRHEIDMTTSTVLRIHCALVLVAAQARSHSRTKDRRAGAGVGVASYTVGLGGFTVLRMVEPDDGTRPLRSRACMRKPMAPITIALVVGLLVAAYAPRGCRDMERTGVTRSLNALVAGQTMNAGNRMSAVLERMLLAALRPDTENAGASTAEGQYQREGAVGLHGIPQVPLARKSPPMKDSYCGVDPTSTAAATSTVGSGV